MNQRVPQLAGLIIMMCLIVAAWSLVAGAANINVRHSYELGTFLVGDDDMTLYLFTPDGRGESTCYGGCAIIWPPLIVSFGEPTAGDGVDGELGLITREDGAKQVVYNGMPLYLWINDQQPGDTTGHGVGGNWFVVNP